MNQARTITAIDKTMTNNKQEFIPLSTPWVSGNEKDYLVECIDTGWLATGPFIHRFEDYVARYVGVEEAVAVSSGTAALHVALRLLEIGEGDEVICPTATFVATTNSVAYTGARPVFLDSEPGAWGLDPEELKRFLENECRRDPNGNVIDIQSGKRIGAILVVHLFGNPADMDPILATADEYGIPIIEDAAESLGSRYREHATGTLGVIGCFSFNGNKTVTSSGGGMLVSKDPEMLERARRLINQGKDHGEEFYHSEVGYNYRLSNLHAAVGLAQVERLDEFLAARRSNAEVYSDAFAGVSGITMVREQEWAKSNYWLSTVLLDPQTFPLSPEESSRALRKVGIEARRPFVPNHTLPPYAGERRFGELAVSNSLYQMGLNLPSSAWMTQEQVRRVADSLVKLAG